MQTITRVDTKNGRITPHDIKAALKSGFELHWNSSSAVDSHGSTAL
jgi:hypothetical protein